MNKGSVEVKKSRCVDPLFVLLWEKKFSSNQIAKHVLQCMNRRLHSIFFNSKI